MNGLKLENIMTGFRFIANLILIYVMQHMLFNGAQSIVAVILTVALLWFISFSLYTAYGWITHNQSAAKLGMTILEASFALIIVVIFTLGFVEGQLANISIISKFCILLIDMLMAFVLIYNSNNIYKIFTGKL